MFAAHPHSWAAKAEACVWLWARISFWPLFVAHELVLLPRRFVIDEPAWEEDLQTAAPKASGGLRRLPLLQTHLQPAIDAVLQPSGTVILRRFEHSWRRSWLLLYNSVVFYAVVALLELSGLDRLVAAFKPEITWLLGTLSDRSGLFQRTATAARGVPVSLINLADPDFSVPYNAAAFPFGVSNFSSRGGGGSSDGSDETAAVDLSSVPSSSATSGVHSSQADGSISISIRQNGDRLDPDRDDGSSDCQQNGSNSGVASSACSTSANSGSLKSRPNAAGGAGSKASGSCGASSGGAQENGGCSRAGSKRDDVTVTGIGGDGPQQNGHTQQNDSRRSADSSSGSRAAGGSRGYCSTLSSGPLHAPLASGCVLSLGDAHLLAAAAKLVYEEPGRIRAVAERWGVQFRAWRCVPAHAAGAPGYVPDVIWMALQTERAVIVAFRGADPFTQVSRRADVPTTLAARRGMGNVLLGFYRAFFHQCEPAAAPQTLNSSPSGRLAEAAAAGGSRCEYDVLEHKLRGLATSGRWLYLTGHSIGAGLAAIFAQALHARGSPLAANIGGIATFGQPRWGDAEAVRLFERRFGDRCLRFTHASDMVPEIPTSFVGYRHHGAWVHIASEALGRSAAARLISEADDPEALTAVVRAEDCGAPLLGLRRLEQAAAAGDVPLFMTRAATLLLPGIGDHFPWDYERALRNALQQW